MQTHRWNMLSLLVGAVLTMAPVTPCMAKAGSGIPKGAFVIHPSVEGELGWDSNIFRNSADDTDTEPVSVGMVKVFPGLRVETSDEYRHKVEGSLLLEGRKYLSDEYYFENQSNFGVHLDTNFHFWRKGAFSLVAREAFHYQPVPGSRQQYVSNVATFDRILNNGYFGILLRPGGGVLEFEPGVSTSNVYFMDYSAANRSVPTLSARLKWKFFPKTALFLRGSYGWRSFDNEYIADASPLRITGGIRGLITPKISMSLEGGYGNLNAEKGDNYEGFIGRVGADYRPNSRWSFGVAYRRDFRDTTWSNYYQLDDFSARTRLMLGSQLSLDGSFHYGIYSFSTFSGDAEGITFRDDEVDQAGNIVRGDVFKSRRDNVLRGDFALTWGASSWLQLSLGYMLDQRITEAGARQYTPDPTVPDPVNEASYVRHQVYFKMSALY